MDDGVCKKCLRPLDDHCFRCEPVVLCPYVTPNGEIRSPCQKVGPASKEPKK